MENPKFKKGDKVVMHTCYEAEHYNGKVWICEDDSFINSSKNEVVFLYGFSGSFSAKFLQLVKI